MRIREELGLLTRPAAEELAADRAEQAAWLAELRRVGLLGDGRRADGRPGRDGALRSTSGGPRRGCSRSRCPDAVGDVRTQNQPGTTDEYPNWRVPLADPDGSRLLLEDVFADPRAGALAEVMRRRQVTTARE